MATRWNWLAAAGCGAVRRRAGGPRGFGPLVARPEPQYQWEKGSETQEGFVTVTDLKLRSQVWRDIPWDHTVRVFRPVMVKYPKTALLSSPVGNPARRSRSTRRVAGQCVPGSDRDPVQHPQPAALRWQERGRPDCAHLRRSSAIWR